jgi:hypothetical protein
MDESIEFYRIGYELTFRRYARSWLHETILCFTRPDEHWGSHDKTAQPYRGSLSEYIPYGWPKPEPGGQTTGPFNGILWKKVYMDDLFLCPKCARFHLSEENDWYTVEQLRHANWEGFIDKIKSRLTVKEFFYKQCKDENYCEILRSNDLKKMAETKRRLKQYKDSQLPVVIQPKAEIVEEVPVESKAFIYLIEGNSLYKIGIATNVTRRKASLQTSSPFELKVIKIWETAFPKKAEKHLHTYLKSHHVRGEWFRLPNNEVESLLQITNLDELLLQST